MNVISYVIVNLLLFFSWYLFIYKFRDYLSFVDRILGAFILGLTQIVLTEMALGVIFKSLYAKPLFFLNISISLSVFVCAVVINRPSEARISRRTLLLSAFLKEPSEKAANIIKTVKGNILLSCLFILSVMSICALTYLGYLFPTYDWDGVFYHLPTAGFILQSGSIENIQHHSLIYALINVFPKNIDLFFIWNIIFLKSDVIVDLSQLVFTIAGIFCLYSLAVKIGIGRVNAMYSSLLFMYAPVILLQSTSNYIDIAVSVLFLMAINFIISISDEQGRAEERGSGNIQVFLAGVTAGLLLGSKGSGPLYVFVLSALFLFIFLRGYFHRRRHDNMDGSLQQSVMTFLKQYAIVFMLPVTLLGSYWYIQNWMYYGNPLFPMNITLFGKTVFRGILNEFLVSIPEALKPFSSFVRPFYVWLEKVDYYFYASDLSGFGPLWFILFLPCLVFSFLYSLFKKNFEFVAIAVLLLFVFIVHPNNWTLRYVIFLFGLGCLSFGLVLSYFEKRGRLFIFASLLLALYVAVFSHSHCIKPGKVEEFIGLSAGERTLARMDPCQLNKTQEDEFGLWQWIDDNVEQGDTVAYTYTPDVIGPLWNSSFSNKIVFIKYDKFKEWIKTLRENNVTYILIKRGTAEAWRMNRLAELRNHPDWKDAYKMFSVAYSDSHNAVIRFSR